MDDRSPTSSPATPASTPAASLPPNPDACHALLLEQAQALVALQDIREQLAQENEELKLTITKLLARLAGHRRERFTEDPKQMHLDFGEDPSAQDALADAAAEAQEIIQEYTVRRKLKPKPPRNEKLPEHLPRYEVLVDAPQDEKTCPAHGQRTLIGYDTTETLEFERPKLKVRVRKYPKYACPQAAECGVAQAERPTGLVEGDRYAPSVAAEIITAKYGYHLPFYRQQDYFAGSGWTPSRSTLLNILAAAEFVLRPLADHLRDVLRQDTGLGCDETRVTLIVPETIPDTCADTPHSTSSGQAHARRIHEVLSEARAKNEPSVNARMWAYRSFRLPINAFDFTVSRHRDGPDEFLKDYRGKLMADCWSGFQKIELRSDSRIVRGACWSHVRRKLLEGRSSHPQQAAVLLALARELYDLEDRAKEWSPEARCDLREREARPILARIREAMDRYALDAAVLPKSVFAEALSYLRNHWEALQLYLTDGRMPIDNNDVEQLMKQIATGRKNWLFVGSVEAGCRAATLLTLVSTCVRNDLDVWSYLNDVLEQILSGSTDYAELRPDVWKRSHPEAVRSYRVDERRDAADRRQVRRARRRVSGRAR